MHDQDRPDNHDSRMPDGASGEFDDLLREIEKEPVPERLLELAQKLRAALLERRKKREDEGRSADA